MDITVHRHTKEGKLEELIPSSGGPHGGIEVDKNFIHLLERICGKNFLNKYRQKNPQGLQKIVGDFENAKKSFDPKGKFGLTLELPFSLFSYYSKEFPEGLDDRIKSLSIDGVTFNEGKLILDHATVSGLFKPVVKDILQEIHQILRKKSARDLRYILMVGGFSEARMLQQELKRHFVDSDNGYLQVCVPVEAQLAILKGAVLFGHNPLRINPRIAKLSYGYETTEPYDRRIHDPEHFHRFDGEKRCCDIFRAIVEKGEKIYEGTERTKLVRPLEDDQDFMAFELFSKDGYLDDPVQYTDEPDVTNIGRIEVKLPGYGLGRKVKVTFLFGGTEIDIKAENMRTGESVRASIDFLSSATE